MELVSTMEIAGEEREIADAYARGQIEGINNNLSQLEIDLKMLGYTVPKEMPVQNYVDSDGVFHQIVGRVDLGSLNWEYDANVFFTKISQKNIYCYLYIFSRYFPAVVLSTTLVSSTNL